MKKIAIVGLGYIGLPTAVIFAKGGCDVVGIDVDEGVIESVNAGEPHIVEPGLAEVLAQVVASGALRATTTAPPADAFIIAVPTPLAGGTSPDLGYVRSAAESIAPVLQPGNLVILESTSPVGTTEQVSQWLANLRPDLTFPTTSPTDNAQDVFVAYCPERVLPGKILSELRNNDRLLGGINAACARAAAELYGSVVSGRCVETTARVAEMAKLVENSYRDVNIAFANELSMLADSFDVNVREVIDLANLHPRVNILTPGAGVGGHCIAVDPWFLIDSAPEETPLIRTAREVNNRKPGWVVAQVEEALHGRANSSVACLGLAYKSDIDDLRESPALTIVEKLAQIGLSELLVVEPNVSELPLSLQSRNIRLVPLDAALGAADLVLGLVAHREFREIQPDQIRSDQTVLDPAGIWS